MRSVKTFGFLLLTLFCSCAAKRSVVYENTPPSGREQQQAFRLLTYNVLTGFQKKPEQADRFVEWASHQHYDVIGLQEMSGFTQDSLERFAKRYGHNYAVLLKGNNSPIGITSRYPLLGVQKITEGMHHGCIYAKTAGFHLFVTHLSPFSYDKCLEEMNNILVMTAKLPSKDKILILGDLNSFSPADRQHYVQSRKYGVIESLLQQGFEDCFTRFNSGFEHSFPTAKYEYKTKNKNRIDYVFANTTAIQNATGARFIKDALTENLSDHYPLEITFNRENQ